jgi:hypothetical protein
VNGLSAFVDESGSDRIRDPHTYMLAAAIYTPKNAPHIRQTLHSLLLPGQRKIHWRDEDHRRRAKLAETVGSLDHMGLIVVRNGQPGEKDERRRRICSERLYFELQQLGVTDACFESRGPADDKRDRHHLDALKARKQVDGSFRINHIPGKADPLLWIPDILCGCLTQARTGNETYLRLIQSSLQIVTLESS